MVESPKTPTPTEEIEDLLTLCQGDPHSAGAKRVWGRIWDVLKGHFHWQYGYVKGNKDALIQIPQWSVYSKHYDGSYGLDKGRFDPSRKKDYKWDISLMDEYRDYLHDGKVPILSYLPSVRLCPEGVLASNQGLPSSLFHFR